jgi:hypothetical protein
MRGQVGPSRNTCAPKSGACGKRTCFIVNISEPVQSRKLRAVKSNAGGTPTGNERIPRRSVDHGSHSLPACAERSGLPEHMPTEVWAVVCKHARKARVRRPITGSAKSRVNRAWLVHAEASQGLDCGQGSYSNTMPRIAEGKLWLALRLGSHNILL